VSTVYSKYIAAAMQTDDEHAQIERAHSPAADVPPLFSGGSLKTDGFPSVAETLAELRAGLAEKYYSEDLLVRAGVTGTALWYAQVVENKQRGITDATDDALKRLDAKAERQARYRAAQGGPSRKPGVQRTRSYTFKIKEELYERASALSVLRGQSLADAMNFLVEAGLTLVDERTKRYEAYVFDNLIRLTTGANAARAALAIFNKEPVPEPARYLDPQSATLRQAYQMVYPLEGAPPTLARLAMEYPTA
jgi:hypothetical protein